MTAAVAIPLSFVGGDIHEYRAGARKLHSVTTILRRLNWYPGYEGIDPKYRKLGTAVHNACQLFDMGLEPGVPYHPEVQARLDHYARFKYDMGFQGRAWEIALADVEREHAGTMDILGVADKEIWMVDIKTGTVPVKGVARQLAGYFDLLQNGRVIPIERHTPVDWEWFEEARRALKFIKRKSLQLTADDYTLRSHDEHVWLGDWRSGLRVFHTWQESGK